MSASRTTRRYQASPRKFRFGRARSGNPGALPNLDRTIRSNSREWPRDAPRLGPFRLSSLALPQNFTIASPPMVNWELLVPQVAVVRGTGHAGIGSKGLVLFKDVSKRTSGLKINALIRPPFGTSGVMFRPSVSAP